MMRTSTRHIYAWALAIQAAAKQSDYDCILVPSEIADMAAKKHGEAVKIGTAVSKGEFEKLTMKQLQKLAQANSISIARTKKDFIKLLKPLEPDVDLDALKGSQLKALIKKHKIGALRSKEELIALLKQQAAKEAKEELTQQLVQKQIEAVKEKIASGLSELPALKPQNFQQALTKLDEMSQALSEAKKLLPEAEWSTLKGQVEFVGESFVQSVKVLSASELKQIAKAAKLHHYQWSSKDELIVLMTSTDKGKIEAAKAGIEANGRSGLKSTAARKARSSLNHRLRKSPRRHRDLSYRMNSPQRTTPGRSSWSLNPSNTKVAPTSRGLTPSISSPTAKGINGCSSQRRISGRMATRRHTGSAG